MRAGDVSESEPKSLRIANHVLVNNRAEGNAPLTVQALTELLRS
jgi:hypothetical protein